MPLKDLVARKVGPERASLTASSIDWSTIPLLGPSATCLWDESPAVHDPCAPFPIAETLSDPKCEPPRARHPKPVWSLGDTLSSTTILRRANTSAVWTAIKRPSGTDALFVASFAGELGMGESRGLARTRRKVAAISVVPHQVYVFRTCEAGCDKPVDGAERAERLTLIGPPSVWVGSSGDPEAAQLSGSAPFTMISAVARPGGATSLTIAYTSVAGSRFQGGENVESVATNVQTVTVEAVWDAPGAPGVTVYRGTIPTGAASDVAEPAAPAPDCE